MPVAYFAEHLNDVFVPALAALLVATLLVVLPAVFAPALKRFRARRALFVLAGLLAAVAVVVAGVEAVAGFGALDAQRAALRRDVADRYGVRLTDAQVGTLLEGGRVKVESGGTRVTVLLRPTGTDHTYTLNSGWRTELPVRA